ncbi:trypsin-like peptidase domain-containing protein [Saccharopolyspora taberi]
MGLPQKHDLIGSALVRFSAGGARVGAGFLLSPDRIATCAHVVADVLGLPRDQSEPPTTTFVVEFPMLRDVDGIVLATRVEVADWWPIGADGTGDIAVLRLLDPAPPGALPAPTLVRDDVWQHPFRVMGFPQGQDDGTWVTGELLAKQGTGWIQLRSGSGQRSIEQGFSGAPVWDDELGGVVGMVVTHALDDPWTAYLLPTTALGDAWNTDPVNPYLGLRSFEEADARLFHGRDDDVARLAALVRDRDLVAVAGPSGSGKSSLVRAGLLPALRADGVDIVDLRPDPDDLARLEAHLVVPERPTVLFLDQFEELVIADPAAARRIVERITEVTSAQPRTVGGPPPLRVVLTLRSRSLDELVTPATTQQLKDAMCLVSTMSQEQFSEVITGPARVVGGLAFEDALAERIVADTVDQPGALPLVALTLDLLWENRHGGWFTHQAYERLGRVAGALSHRAEEVYRSLSETDQRLARRLLVQLTRPDGEGGFARRSLRMAELHPDLHPVVLTLAHERLVVVAHQEDGGQRVDLVHQALIDQWSELQGWLREDEEFLTWQADLRQAVDQWEQADRDPGSLLRGTTLARATEWAQQHDEALTPEQRDFVQRSKRAERSRARMGRAITVLAVVVALVVGLLAAVVVQRNAEVNRQLDATNADLLAQQVERADDDNDYGSSLQFALTAWREDPGSAAAYGGLLMHYIKWQQAERVYRVPDGTDVHHTSTSADGLSFVVVDDDSRVPVQLWTELDRPEPVIGRLPITNAINATMSPDGQTVATVNVFGAVELWSTRTLDRIAELKPPIADIPVDYRVVLPHMTFSGDGRFLSVLPGVLPQGRPENKIIETFDTRTLKSVDEPQGPASEISVNELSPTRDPNVRLGEINAGDADAPLSTRVVELPQDRPGTGHEFGMGRIISNGDEVLRCLSEGVVEIVDRASKAPKATFSGIDCYAKRIGDYLVGSATEPPPKTDDPTTFTNVETLLAIHIPSGRRFQYAHPESVLGSSDVLAVVPGADGSSPDVVLRSFNNVFRIAMAEPLPPAAGDWGELESSVTTGFVRANTIAATTTTGEIVLLDETYTRLLARIPKPAENTTLEFNRNGRQLFVATPQKVLVYRLPDLHLEREVPIPQPDYPWLDYEQDGYSYVGYLSPTEVVVLHAGVLSYWDPGTWQQRSEPIPLSTDRAEIDNLVRNASLYERSGHPGQVVVSAGWTTAVWSVPDRRKIAAYEISTRSGADAVMVSNDGAVFAYSDDWGNISVLDLETGRNVTGVATGEGPALIGPERLVTAGPQSMEVWDWRRRIRIGSVSLPPVQNQVTSPEQIIAFRPGQPPLTIPLDARTMAEALCRISDRGFTPDEIDVLPAGVDTDPPCRGLGK